MQVVPRTAVTRPGVRPPAPCDGAGHITRADCDGEAFGQASGGSDLTGEAASDALGILHRREEVGRDLQARTGAIMSSLRERALGVAGDDGGFAAVGGDGAG
nr:hypothetical protein [uncultured Cohaesibacter sp.]